MSPIESFVLDEGTDAYGTQTRVKFESDQIVKVQTFDAEPIVEACKAERNATAGERWGEMRKVGSIPMAVYTQALAIADQKERHKYLRTWLKTNTAFVTFDRYLR